MGFYMALVAVACQGGTARLARFDAERAWAGLLLPDWSTRRRHPGAQHRRDAGGAGRLKEVEAMLSTAGFRRIVVERSPILISSNIVSLFATR